MEKSPILGVTCVRTFTLKEGYFPRQMPVLETLFVLKGNENENQTKFIGIDQAYPLGSYSGGHCSPGHVPFHPAKVGGPGNRY